MNSKEIFNILENFDWSKLNRIYGCAHNSIIGFITYEWINNCPDNSILDGAPSPYIGKGRSGQKNADLLLCKNQTPFISVEVETQVYKFTSKLNALYNYKEVFQSIDFGMLYMTNLTTGNLKYKHNWDDIKKEIQNKKQSIALISAEKTKLVFREDDKWSNLLKRNDYSKWEIVNIDYWIYVDNNDIKAGNLYRKP